MFTRYFQSASRTSWTESSSRSSLNSNRLPSPSPEEGTLEVQLLNARDLRHTDFFKKSDPYAILTYGSQTRKSHVARGQGTKPEWNQVFHFQIEPRVTELLIALYDEDYLTKDDFLGTVTVPLHEVFSNGLCPAKPYPVVRPSKKYKGEVRLQLSFIPPKKTEPKMIAQRACTHPPEREIRYVQENDYIDFPGPYGRRSAGGWTIGVY